MIPKIERIDKYQPHAEMPDIPGGRLPDMDYLKSKLETLFSSAVDHNKKSDNESMTLSGGAMHCDTTIKTNRDTLL